MSQSDFVHRGQALVSSGQFQEAVKVCRLGLLGRPTTVEGRVVLGQALLALKRYDEVLAEMRVALELDHASLPAHLLKGEALLRKGDPRAALDALRKVREQAAGNAQLAALLGEAERSGGGSAASSLGLLTADDSAFSADQGTKNYPTSEAATRVDPAVDPSASGDGEYTRPTSIAAAPRRRSSRQQVVQSGDAGASSDRTGTVEVDPDLDVVDASASDDDLGDLVEPPVERAEPAGRPAIAGRPVKSTKLVQRTGGFKEISTVELGDEEMVEVDDLGSEPAAGVPGLGDPGGSLSSRIPVPGPPAHLAQLIANQPHLMNLSPVLPLAAQGTGRATLATATPGPGVPAQEADLAEPPVPLLMPLAARLPLPGVQPMPHLPPPHAQAMPEPVPAGPAEMTTLIGPPPVQHGALAPYPEPPANQLHELPFHREAALAAARAPAAMSPADEPMLVGGGNGPASPWGRPPPGTSPPRPIEPPRRAADPQLAARPGGAPGGGSSAGPTGPSNDSSNNRMLRSGARRARSRLSLAVWVMIGAAVIGGGVYAGFQIRSMRLGRQITAARERAVDLAKADTWQGWIGARDALSSIAQASPTADNKAALARARAVLAYEFGDGLSDAKAAVDALAGQPGIDLELAAAYLALAQSDAKTAREFADRVQRAAADDPAGLYVSGQAAMLAGDTKAAVADLRRALDRESRPLYAVALARALAASTAWDDALATIDRGTDNPAAVIEKAFLVTSRAAAVPGNELRAQLVKLIAEGHKPAAEQARGVSPSQIAFAHLALAQVDFARSEPTEARADYVASLGIGLSEQRFAEQFSETLYAIGELDGAQKSALRALETWPASRRARTTLAQVWLALGDPVQAVEAFTKDPDAASWPKGQTVRGQARLATGDLDGARADFDAALKKLPGYEPALVGGAWLDLANGAVADARQRIEPRFNAKAATPAMVAVYAAILRMGNDPTTQAKAKALLERAAAGGPTPDSMRVQLELARVDRELGNVQDARAAYAQATQSGNAEARFERAQYLIETGSPPDAREALEQLLVQAGDHPTQSLLLETARARTLTGAHAEAAALLAVADQTTHVVRWQLERERARIALSRDDTAGAAPELMRALESCGIDFDTFILAADTVAADPKQTQLAAKLKALIPARLRGRPELEILAGKAELAATPRPRLDEAERHYAAASAALDKEKATPRRRAQAEFGLAAVAYAKGDDATARSTLDRVIKDDPSIYAAYLFQAELTRSGSAKKAVELALQAAAYNPESLDAWKLVATLGDRKQRLDAIAHISDLAPGSETLREVLATPPPR